MADRVSPTQQPIEVAGVDGCDGGWLVVRAQAADRLEITGVTVEPNFQEVQRRTRNCSAVAIDIPIGLSDDGPRSVDREARRLLSPLRHSSVFPAPVRAVLLATSYAEACEISVEVRPDRKRISKQTYYLGFKIRDVDDAMCADPMLQERIVEIHPELCFWMLNGEAPLPHYKKTDAGSLERFELLSEVFLDMITEVAVPTRAASDDLVDACAAAWTAARYARGQAERIPESPAFDSRGLRMEMWY